MMIKKKSNYKFFIGLAVALLLPLSFYLIAKILDKDKIRMPSYYRVDNVITKNVNGKNKADTIFHQIKDLQLINQLGDTVFLNQDLKGKILVINFFFSSCPGVCPKLTKNMKMLQNAFRKNTKKKQSMDDEVHLVSITVNPEDDNVQALRTYADRFSVNHDHWWFLTGEKKAIYDFARNELAVSVEPGDGSEDDFIHTQNIIVVDKQRFIRGYYDGLDSAAIGKCAYDISLLSMEKK